jgi:hypothetical protein
MVMKDLETMPPTFRLKRGDFLSPATDEGPLQPGVPDALQAAASQQVYSNRMDLARWIVSRDNPLTARVVVNRVWSRYFGRGIVETENDFGYQGSLPTHPELLDWLAAEFMEHEWSLKHLHRTIVLSKTYRQSSTVQPQHLRSDPENYWLGRQSRFRVEAEIVRDQALSASGLLTPKIGGPSVHPQQPDGVYDFTQNKKSWPTETGPDRFRRTLYTMFYRSAPYPLLTTFDAPDFSTVCTARVRSNTPLQSLTMANDDVFVEAARGLAADVLKHQTSQETSDVLETMFRRCFSRHPESAESQLLVAFWQNEQVRFASVPEQAEQFAGKKSPDLAAWTSVARVLLNTDEFVTRN